MGRTGRLYKTAFKETALSLKGLYKEEQIGRRGEKEASGRDHDRTG